MDFHAVLGRVPRPRRSGGRWGARPAALLAASVGFAGLAALPASAANNPGTGDSGFFTFRPAAGVGGTQINVASGNALVRTRDLADGPLTYHVVVDRFYNSLDPDSYTILSPRWGFDVGPDTKLTVESNQDATVRGPSGYRIRFARQADGSYVAPEGFDGALVKTPSGWTLSRASVGDEFGFDGSGNLSWTKDSELRDFTVQGTSAAGRTILSSYGTNSGRRVNLSYTTAGDYFVRLMDDPASGHHWYRYSGGRLSEYESPTGAITGYGYDSNGFLDEIIEPGGTTVELDVSSSGKVRSITTTLPGGVPQTTSFVYARRTYKTDVTAPDTTRRTYAYDDDWRVTRDYDPDVVPTVTASGELRDLADGYVGPNRTYPLAVAAEQPDGAGLRRLLVERSNGTEIEGKGVPCTTTPFDLVCPTNRTTNLDVSFANVPEGEQAIRAAADDDEGHHATSDGWKVLVDKTSPTPASNFQLSYFDPHDSSASASINWALPTDPDLADESPGAGVDVVEVRYRVGSGSFGAWLTAEATEGNNQDGETEVNDGELAVFGLQVGDDVTIEVRATDAVGNVSAVGTATVTVAEQLEDPIVEAKAAEAYRAEYGGSDAEARAWMRVQDRTDDVANADISAALPGAYGGVWLDNDARRFKIGVVGGQDTSDAQQIIDDVGLAAHTDFVPVANTQRQLELAQIDLDAELSDLLASGLLMLGRDNAINGLRIDIASTASPAQRSRIQAAATAAPVRVVVSESGWDPSDYEDHGCITKQTLYYCDGPIRGGVGIGEVQAGEYSRLCTAGFSARTASGTPAILTAGHCVRGMYGNWYTLNSSVLGVFGTLGRSRIGPSKPGGVQDHRGDLGAVLVQQSSPFWPASQRLSAVLVNDNRIGQITRLNYNYGIRKVGAAKRGRWVCMSGSTTGTHCMQIIEVAGRAPNGVTGSLAIARGCASDFGDSGGPYYKAGRAIGIHSGLLGAGNGYCLTMFSAVGAAPALIDTTVTTRR